jgi:hypothetical protein
VDASAPLAQSRRHQRAQFVALRKIWPQYLDDFKGRLVERLGLPALPATFPLAAVKFQGNDDRE